MKFERRTLQLIMCMRVEMRLVRRKSEYRGSKVNVRSGIGGMNCVRPTDSQQGGIGNKNGAKLTRGHRVDQRQIVQAMTHPALLVLPLVSSSAGTLPPSLLGLQG